VSDAAAAEDGERDNGWSAEVPLRRMVVTATGRWRSDAWAARYSTSARHSATYDSLFGSVQFSSTICSVRILQPEELRGREPIDRIEQKCFQLTAEQGWIMKRWMQRVPADGSRSSETAGSIRWCWGL